MAEAIYPNADRKNCLASMYCEMAMQSYYHAHKFYNVVQRHGYSYLAANEQFAMNKEIISTIIFSAMTIESFLNDYASACLGDTDFREYFDKLSPEGKLVLIAKFIFKTDIDKEQAYYSYFKTLIKQRNEYVHNKSNELCNQESGENKCDDNHIDCDIPTFDKSEIEMDIRKARDSIKGIKAIADYFDQYDSSVHAVSRLFTPEMIPYVSKDEQRYKKFVFSELGIKVKL